MAWNSSRPMTRQIEHVFDDDRSGEQKRELQPHDGDHRNECIAHRMAPQRRIRA